MQDLEIYIRDLEAGAVSRWLSDQLGQVSLDDEVITGFVKGHARHNGNPLSLSLYPGAFGKRFTCLVIEGPLLPWNSDLDCARSAWRAIGGELRCSPGNWAEGRKMRWLRIQWIGWGIAGFFGIVFIFGKTMLGWYGEQYVVAYPSLCVIAPNR